MPKDDLDRHRQEAKRLRRAFAAGDADAVRRVRSVMGEAAVPPAAATLPHAGALHVIAREPGGVEAGTDRDAPADLAAARPEAADGGPGR